LPNTSVLESIRIQPNPILLTLGEQKALQVIGDFSSGESFDVTRSVVFSVTPSTIASIDQNGIFYTNPSGGNAALGSGMVSASIGDSSASLQAEARVEVSAGLQKELRGVWVTRWNYSTEAELRQIIAQAADTGFNAVFLQVRGTADAYYQSNLEPWASKLWDPLGAALDEAHQRGVSLHAWLNTVPIWSGSSAPPESVPRHLLLDHPEWLMVDDTGRRQQLGDTGYLCLSPGIPAAQDHLLAVFNDLLTSYAVDGLHLDYIRYYGSQYSHDPESERRFVEEKALSPSLDWPSFQRAQISQIVGGAYSVVKGFPKVRLTTAVWHNNNLNVAGSRGARDYYQDSHAWLAEGLVDAIVPMNYLRMDSNPSFSVLADDHLAHASGRHVYMGINVLGRESTPDPSGAQMLLNMSYARDHGAQGLVLFAWPYLTDNLLLDDLKAGPFAEPAEIPALSWR